MIQAAESLARRGFGAAIVIVAALQLSGCAMGIGEFAKNSDRAALTKDVAVDDTTTASLKPAALVEEEPAAAAEKTPAAVAVEAAVPPSGYPNLNAVPPTRTSKLLTPEEKAKVIAELEGLAQKQAVALNKERAAQAAQCDNLSAEELRKRMLQGAC
jgi:hypothetical protein